MKTPAHRRKKDPFGRALLAPLIRRPIPRCPTCGKHRYDTEASAALALRKHSASRFPPLRPYFDEKCQTWHLSSKPAREAS